MPEQTIRAWRSGDGGQWRATLLSEDGHEAFDAFVRGSPRGHPLQLWSWGDLKRGDGWSPLRVTVQRDGRVVAAASVVEKAVARVSGSRIWLSHRGPVAEPGTPAAEGLWEALRIVAARRGALALRCDPEWPVAHGRALEAAGLVRLPPRDDWYLGALEPLRVWRISLQGGVEAVLSRMEPHTRYDVRRFGRKGIVLRDATAADVPAFHALEGAVAQRKALALRSPEFFSRLWSAWNAPGDGRLLLATWEGRIVGGAWFVVCGRGCWGQFAAADLAYRRLLPTVGLYRAGILWAIARGCAFCDFGGIGHREDAADGLMIFKKGFGPGDTRFCGEFDLVFQPAAYRAFRLAEEARWAWYGRRGAARARA